MRLSTLLAALPIPTELSGGDAEITAIEHDSRRVTEGALFVARRGGSANGHRYVGQAIDNGAAAVMIEKSTTAQMTPEMPVPIVKTHDSTQALAWLCAAFQGFPARKLVMIGVTGTDGKTTTSNLIHSILLAAGLKAGLISTVNAVIGEKVLDTGLHTTTPDAADVQKYLAQMVEAGMTHCVLETTSHGLAQHRVTGCEFDIAVVTNITHEHLDFHGSLDAYRVAKAKLFEGLATAYKKPNVEKLAVLNADDWSFDYLRERISVPFVSYGLGSSANVRAKQVRRLSGGTRFTVETNKAERINITSNLIGDYNISNCLAAIATGSSGLNLPSAALADGIASLQGVIGRMEHFDLGQDFTAIVDFAHTPNALKSALETAQSKKGNSSLKQASNVIVVFGSAGLRDKAKRKLMGEIAAEFANYAVITAEDPRTESLTDIMAESAEGLTGRGGVEGENFWRIPDRGEAIQFAVNMAQAGDVVIVCGKAHEQSMCFGDIEYPWDDRLAMQAALCIRLGISGPEMPQLPTSKGWPEVV
jgi:UDP-N-acetylmuramoyl-L-alanyl-D-glutamate--2,6-diaminopimelate ligase